MASVRSVNVGRPREAAWTTIGRTSILKEQVIGPARVGEHGLEGDQVSNPRHHGGPDKAVYAFAREDLDRWAEVLGAEIDVVAPGGGSTVSEALRAPHGL